MYAKCTAVAAQVLIAPSQGLQMDAEMDPVPWIKSRVFRNYICVVWHR